MEKWLEPLSEVLDRSASPVTVFFRDDDAGWGDARLFDLLDCFEEYGLPIDFAVIPEAIRGRAEPLYDRVAAGEGLIGIHQHGLSHTNHQPEGRKCEFGDARSPNRQMEDIGKGRALLEAYFGEQVDSIFTPPWNRCTQDTVGVLTDLGFAALSRDNTAAPLETGPLREIPVNVDWFKKRRGQRLGRDAMGRLLARAAASGDPVGVMLHHEPMDSTERDALCALLALLAAHPAAECVRMKDRLAAKSCS